MMSQMQKESHLLFLLQQGFALLFLPLLVRYGIASPSLFEKKETKKKKKMMMMMMRRKRRRRRRKKHLFPFQMQYHFWRQKN